MKWNEYIIQKVYPHKYGIMGTVIFHLLLMIVLLSMQIAALHEVEKIEIELVAPPEELVKKIQEEKQRREELRKKVSQEEVQKMLRSIAVNEETKKSPASSSGIRQYMEEIKKELAAESRYGSRYKVVKDKNYTQDSLQYLRDRKEAMLDSLKSTFYSGKSSVSYRVEGRYARFLPIPVFKCEFGGEVVVTIGVDPRGRVQRAEVVAGESKQDDCLWEAAVNAALRSRFNEKPGAPALQVGRITYNFVKQ